MQKSQEIVPFIDCKLGTYHLLNGIINLSCIFSVFRYVPEQPNCKEVDNFNKTQNTASQE